mgnify:FL=1
MALFRKHRGGLVESLETVKEVESLNDVADYCSNDISGRPTDLECKYQCMDDRIGWDSYIITGVIYGSRCVLGFSNNNLKWLG